MDAEIKAAAQILWNYLKLDQPLAHCDCIIAMGSHDLRVAAYAVQVFLEGWAPLLVCSGGLGRLTRLIWQEAEARQFAAVALKAGVPENRILIEDRSSNTGENVRFTRELLTRQDIKIDSALLIHKPYMERRALATALKVWPELRYCVSSPPMAFEDYPNEDISMDEMIHIMVGDFQRILEYSARGYQVPQEVPNQVMLAYRKLIDTGYKKQVLSA
jgi:uncharacterized SAM-binding protein YcdF (DUF218 family)